jgi:hypothetical protein
MRLHFYNKKEASHGWHNVSDGIIDFAIGKYKHGKEARPSSLTSGSQALIQGSQAQRSVYLGNEDALR